MLTPLELTYITAKTATLADLRARVGLSKTEVAAELGVARHLYDRIERGLRELESALAGRLAEILQVPQTKIVAAHRWTREAHAD